MKSKLRVGIIGVGALGQALTSYLAKCGDTVEVVGHLRNRQSSGDDGQKYSATLQQILDKKPDTIVECAGQSALLQYGLSIVKAGVNLVPASVGALVDDRFREALLETSSLTGASVRMPSGAIIGIDGLTAASHVGIEKVMYRGTMPTSTLKGHYEGELPESGLVFSGSARGAVSRFPKNVNLTGTIALAGIGFDRTLVEMLIDPTLTANVHELFVKGAFGEFHVKISGYRISDASPSSQIVAGSLAQAVLGSNFTLLKK